MPHERVFVRSMGVAVGSGNGRCLSIGLAGGQEHVASVVGFNFQQTPADRLAAWPQRCNQERSARSGHVC